MMYTNAMYLIPAAPSIGATISAAQYPSYGGVVSLRGPSGPALLVLGVYVDSPYSLYSRLDCTIEVNGNPIKVPLGGSGNTGFNAFVALSAPLSIPQDQAINIRAAANIYGTLDVTLLVTDHANITS